jgi:LacI family transcriptional regulator
VVKNFNLFFSYVESAYEGYQSLPKIIREKNVDGVLSIGRSDRRMVKDIQERKIPVVAIDNYPALQGVDVVQMDNKRGGLIATEHLIQLGHRNIGLLTIEKPRPSLEDREEGWKIAHGKNNLQLNKDFIFRSQSLTFQAAYERTKEALKDRKKLTALFCVNDEMAAGALRAAHEIGRKVPQNLSIVGFDNVTMSNYTDPPLTTVNAPKEYMGKLAVVRLLELVEKKDLSPIRQEVPVELIVRQSTAKPGRN